jgi:hypothetical protein
VSVEANGLVQRMRDGPLTTGRRNARQVENDGSLQSREATGTYHQLPQRRHSRGRFRRSPRQVHEYPSRARLIALSSILAGFAVDAGSDASWRAPVQKPATAEVADPMASFARMLPGEWRVTYLSGKSSIETWHWGPGRRSLRVVTSGSDAAGNPMRGVQVVYWHPGRKQVCTLGLEGAQEGTIRLEGERADAVLYLHQNGGLRKLGLRWDFDGPDKYHEQLLEQIGPGEPKTTNAFDYVRSKSLTAPLPRTAAEAPKLSKRLKPFEPLFGHTWETKGDSATVDAHIQSTCEWVWYTDGVYARTVAPSKDGEPVHVLDAYLYHPAGTDTLRCLALSSSGGVFEGDVTVIDGAVQLDLKGYEGERVVPYVVRLDFAEDGTLRERVWSLAGRERELIRDVHHARLEPKQD